MKKDFVAPLQVTTLPVGVLKPKDMDSIPMSREMKASLANVALSIFTDCTNADKSFSEAILAVYLSGLNHGKEASKPH